MYFDLADEAYNRVFRKNPSQTLFIFGLAQYGMAIMIGFFSGPSSVASVEQGFAYFLFAMGGTLCMVQSFRLDEFINRYQGRAEAVIHDSGAKWAGNIYSSFLYLGFLTIVLAGAAGRYPILLPLPFLLWFWICSDSAFPRLELLVKKMNRAGLTNIKDEEFKQYYVSGKDYLYVSIAVALFAIIPLAFGTGSFGLSVTRLIPEYFVGNLASVAGWVIWAYREGVDFAISTGQSISAFVGSAIAFVDNGPAHVQTAVEWVAHAWQAVKGYVGHAIAFVDNGPAHAQTAVDWVAHVWQAASGYVVAEFNLIVS